MRKRKSKSRRSAVVMSITAPRRQLIRSLADALGKLVPATAYGEAFCFEALAKEKRLRKYWQRKRNKLEMISHFLENLCRYHERLPRKIIREVLVRGVERRSRQGRPVTGEELQQINRLLQQLGFDMSKEISKIEVSEQPAPTHVPPSELVQLGKHMGLHRRLQGDCVDMFEEGHLNEAVRKALERFEKLIQDATGCHNSHGQDLMAKAFREDDPLIAINELKTETDESEQRGFKFLTMGAMAGLRNLYSHGDTPQMSPTDALQRLAFVSMLFKRVEGAPGDRRGSS